MAALTGWRLPAIQWAFSLFVLFQAWVQPVAAMLFDLLGGWSAVLYGCGALSLLSAALAYHLKVRPLPEKRSGVAIS
jgi:MFS family permease